jgi:hypothetical protein
LQNQIAAFKVFVDEVIVPVGPWGYGSVLAYTEDGTLVYPSKTLFPIGVTKVTVRVSDGYNDPVLLEFTITCYDIGAPVPLCPNDMFYNNTSGEPLTAVEHQLVGMSDNNPQFIPGECTMNSFARFCQSVNHYFPLLPRTHSSFLCSFPHILLLLPSYYQACSCR